MSNYSKFIASIIGGVLGLLVAKFALPAELVSDAVVQGLTSIVMSSLAVYIAPANRPG
jgi:hypothetical protein